MTRRFTQQHNTLEPRVAALEVGLDRLTADVTNLTTAVREQGATLETQIQQLIVATTQATGPRKTDWSTIIAAVMLVLAIGSAAFWPLNQTSQENKAALATIEDKMDSHAIMASHPVGMALIQRLEEHGKLHREIDDQEHQTIRTHFHEELELISKQYDTALKALESKVDLHNDRLYARVVKIEDVIAHDRNSDLNELRLWRLRAMNGDIQSKAPISNDIIFDPHVPTKEEGVSSTP